jgi:hypothetical protein
MNKVSDFTTLIQREALSLTQGTWRFRLVEAYSRDEERRCGVRPSEEDAILCVDMLQSQGRLALTQSEAEVDRSLDVLLEVADDGLDFQIGSPVEGMYSPSADDFSFGVLDERECESDFEFSPTANGDRLIMANTADFHLTPGQTFPELIESQADYYASHETEFGDFMAGKIYELAGQAKILSASSPLDFEQREADALASMKEGA